MKILQTVIIGIVVITIAFGSGYLLGTAKIFKFKSTISNLKSEIVKKDAQLLLVQIKADLKQSASDVTDKNFGLAAGLISKNRKAIAEKISGFDEETALIFKSIDTSMDKINKSIEATRASSKEEINTLLKNIDKMLQKE